MAVEETVEGIKLTMGHLTEFLKDDDQTRLLGYLSKRRDIPVEELKRAGIFYVPDVSELDYISEVSGVSLNEMGVYSDNERMYTNGYIIPVRDSQNRIIYYINYNYERDGSKKYIMIHPGNYTGDRSIRLYGMHTFKESLKYDSVAVVEGSFDHIRLSMEGIPSVAILGTKLTQSQKLYLLRFRNIYYIPDNDVSGEDAYTKFKYHIPRAVKYPLLTGKSDVDDFGKQGGSDYRLWVDTLKKKMGII